MKIGCCMPGNFTLPDSAFPELGETLRALVDGSRFLREAGYDYLEFNVPALVNLSDADMAQAEALRAKGLLCLEACNGFIPGTIPLTGPDRDPAQIRAYLEKALSRLGRLGVEVVVFGSGGARRIPDGFDRETALAQLDEVFRTAEAIARENGVTIVIEPLNRNETNCIPTVTEGAAIVRRLNLPNLKLLGDAYHMYVEGEDPAVLSDNRDILRHVHVAEPVNRTVPVDCPYLRQVSKALRESGYTGRVSIEGRLTDLPREVREAQALMRDLF